MMQFQTSYVARVNTASYPVALCVSSAAEQV